MSLGLSTSNSSRIYQFLFGLGFLALSVNTVKGMMRGNTRNVRMFGALSIVIGIVLALDKYYWILCPLCWLFQIKIPGLPFDSTEIGCLSVAAVHFVRMGLGKEEAVHWNQKLLVSFPLFLWIAMVWAMRPAGLNMLGGSTMGGRFYFRIVVGYLALFALSTVQVGEKEARLLFRGLVAAALLQVFTSVLLPSLLQTGWDFGSENSSTHYVFLCFVPVYWIGFARYSLKDILQNVWRLFAMGIFGGFVLMSGKRSSTASMALIPIYRAFLTRKQWRLTIAVGVIAFMVLALGVAGDGTFYQIPRSTARALALVFPKYRRIYRMEGTRDTFREFMRNEAQRIIHDHPWIGRGGFRMDASETRWVNYRDIHFNGHLLAGAWHSAIYAYPADFGIPAFLFWLLFFGYSLQFLFKLAKRVRDGTYLSACVYYYGFCLLHSAVTAYTTGHSAMSTLGLCFQYGMILALENGLRRDNQELV